MAINDFLGAGGRALARRAAEVAEEVGNEVQNLSSDQALRDFHESIGGGEARYRSLSSYEQDLDSLDPRGRDQRNTVAPSTESTTTLPSQNRPATTAGNIQTVSNRPYILTNPLDDRFDFRTGQKVHTLSNTSAALNSQRGLGLGGSNTNTPQGQPTPDSYDPRGRNQTPPPPVNTPTYEPVDPRPTEPEEREARIEWDNQYRLTHKPDGTPLAQYDVNIVGGIS